MRERLVACGLVALAVGGGGARVALATGLPAPVRSCAVGALSLLRGAEVVARTQQTPLLLALVNVGGVACSLDGHPRIRIRAKHALLDHCPAGDPGHRIDISPFEPSAALTAPARG